MKIQWKLIDAKTGKSLDVKTGTLLAAGKMFDLTDNFIELKESEENLFSSERDKNNVKQA